MVTPVQVYKCSDGEVFGSESEALKHESTIKNKVVIEAFLDRHYPVPTEVGEDGKVKKAGPGRSIAGKAIALWLAENS